MAPGGASAGLSEALLPPDADADAAATTAPLLAPPPPARRPPTTPPPPAAAAKKERAGVVALASGMLLAGTVNTLLTKYADLQVVGADPLTGRPLLFTHPAFQSALMFFGELLCLVPWLFFRSRRRAAKRRADPGYVPRLDAAQRRALGVRRLAAFALPALCDAAASTAMNLGLALTAASTYQMLRGTLVLWTGLFTVGILRRRLRAHHWMGMALITAGAALVGAASVLGPPSGGGGGGKPHGGGGGGKGGLGAAFGFFAADANSANDKPPDAAPAPLLGDALVVAAQAGTALQFVLEEAFLRRYRVPALLAVGLEGAWGAALSAAVLLPLASRIRPAGPGTPPLDDLSAAARELRANPRLLAASLLSVFSVAAFNFCGIGVTKRLSGASRATIDATRTLFVWLFALSCGWERVLPLQLLGFAVLVAGSSLYNEILRPCLPADLVAGAAAAAAAAAAAEAAAAERGSGVPGALRYRRVPTPTTAVYGGGELGVAVVVAGEQEVGGSEEEEDEEVLLVVDDGGGGGGGGVGSGQGAAAAAAAAAGVRIGGSGGGVSAGTDGGASASSSAVPVPPPRPPHLSSPWGGYALARSMRLGPGALSPRSLVPSGGSALALAGGSGGGVGGTASAGPGGASLLLGGSVDVGGGGAAGGGGEENGGGSGSASASSASSVGGSDEPESASGVSSGSLLGPPGYLATQTSGELGGGGTRRGGGGGRGRGR